MIASKPFQVYEPGGRYVTRSFLLQQPGSTNPKICAATQHWFEQRGRKRVCTRCGLTDGRVETRRR